MIPVKQIHDAVGDHMEIGIKCHRNFMRNQLGTKLKPEALPFSNMPAYLPPFWLSPGRAMRAVNYNGAILHSFTPTPNPSPIKREGLNHTRSRFLSSPSLLVGEGAGGWGED